MARGNEEPIHRGLQVPGIRNQKNIRLLSGKADPRVTGVRAPIGSKYYRRNGSDFNKDGPSNFDWEPCCGIDAEGTATSGEAITWDRERIRNVDEGPADTVVSADDATALAAAVAAAAPGDVIEVANPTQVYNGFDFVAGTNLLIRGLEGSTFNITEIAAGSYCVGVPDEGNGNTIARAAFVPAAPTSNGIEDLSAATGFHGLFVKDCTFTDCADGVNSLSGDGTTGIIIEGCDFEDCDTPVNFVSVVGIVIRDCFNQGSVTGFFFDSCLQVEIVLCTSVECTSLTVGDGFRFENSNQIELYGCASAFNAARGFYFGDAAGGGTGQNFINVEFCVANDNELSGILANAGSYAKVTNSIITDNGARDPPVAGDNNGITATEESMIESRFNWIDGNNGSPTAVLLAGIVSDMGGNVIGSGDPMFSSPATFDFSLAGDSPAIGGARYGADFGVDPERHYRVLQDYADRDRFGSRSVDQAFFRPGVVLEDAFVAGMVAAGIPHDRPTIYNRAAIQIGTPAAGTFDIVIANVSTDDGAARGRRVISVPGAAAFVSVPSLGVGGGEFDGLPVGLGQELQIFMINIAGDTPSDINVFVGGDEPVA